MKSHFSSANENAELNAHDDGLISMMNPITGVPILANEKDEINLGFVPHYMIDSDSLDFGEFHDSAADVQANSRMNASCGILSKK